MSEPIRNRIVGEGERPASEFTPNVLNWREHSSFQRAALLGALGEVGWVQRVVVNRTTGNLIDGHLRVEVARERGESVPYVEVEISEAEERLILATLDPLAALATADQEALKLLIAQVSTDDESLRELLAQLGAGEIDVETDFEPGESPGRGLSQLLLLAPTEDVEHVRALLLEVGDERALEGGVDERLGRAAVAIVREWEARRKRA